MPDVWSGTLVNAASIGATTDQNVDVNVQDFRTLTVTARMTTTTATDLVLSVRAYDTSGALVDVPLVPEENVAPTVTGAQTYAVQEYDLSGVDRVQVRVRNASAGAKTATAGYFGDVL